MTAASSSKLHWSNKSVLAFAQGADPVAAIERITRETALSAIDEGWDGPPYDPIRLAKILKIDVSPNADIADARTVPVGRNKFLIQFNPQRPRGRVRFSVAHEIAHTFFPDCGERVRNRERTSESDYWQIEVLCNIAAAELIMPVGDVSGFIYEQPSIDKALEKRRELDVSVEALLIRIAKLSQDDFLVYCASRSESGPKVGRYRIDYVICSPRCGLDIVPGVWLSEDTAAKECTAVGYTAKMSEMVDGTHVRNECVGLPPYPGRRFPRVAGFLCSIGRATARDQSEIKYVSGNALQPQGNGNKLVAHVVNNKTPNWGGAGFAAAVRREWKHVQDSFRNWVLDDRSRLTLGNVHLANATDDIDVFSMIAQRGWGESSRRRIQYSALEKCLSSLAERAKAMHATIHMPLIGIGHGGGDWTIVEDMITQLVVNQGLEVTVYRLRAALYPTMPREFSEPPG